MKFLIHEYVCYVYMNAFNILVFCVVWNQRQIDLAGKKALIRFGEQKMGNRKKEKKEEKIADVAVLIYISDQLLRSALTRFFVPLMCGGKRFQWVGFKEVSHGRRDTKWSVSPSFLVWHRVMFEVRLSEMWNVLFSMFEVHKCRSLRPWIANAE